MRCFICKLEATGKENIEDCVIECPRCGKYWIRHRSPQSLIGDLSSSQIANVSYWISHNETPVIDSENIVALKNLRTPTVGEKAERLLHYFVRLNPIPGKVIELNDEDPSLLSTIGCYDSEELSYVTETYLTNTKNFIERMKYAGALNGKRRLPKYKITPSGWAYIEKLKELNPESQIGFVAMWFNKSYEKVYERSIKVGIEEAGYEPLRIDLREHNNRIDDEIIATIKRSKFLVADFTGQRGGVYFEAGYALGLGLEVIWLCSKKDLEGNKIHFDTRQYNFITWEEDKLDDLKNRLRFRIERTIGRGTYNPGE